MKLILLLTTDDQELASGVSSPTSTGPGPTMCSVMVLFLLLAAENSATQPENSTGDTFIIAFPENIASYYPALPENTVQITAMHDDTKVTITSSGSHTEDTLKSGGTWDFQVDPTLELSRSESPDRVLQITSTKEITVHAINLKNNSVQTALVMPIDKLGKEYFIPPVPTIQGTTVPVDTAGVCETCPFKLVVINGNYATKITLQGKSTSTDELSANQVIQIWVNEDKELLSLLADQPVAVLFAHACAIRDGCTCGLLYTILPPAKEEKLKFYVPPILADGTENEAFILLSNGKSPKVEVFDPNSSLVETVGTAIFYKPGLLLPLIPETDFATCYVVNSITGAQSSALIIAHKDLKDGVHVGSHPLNNSTWKELQGTEYVSTKVDLVPGMSVIWHNSSKMAVYFVGSNGSALFGNPAPIISKTPDFRGCVLTPEIVEIGDVADGWRESLKYCRDQNLDLVSLPDAVFQKQIYPKILQARNDNLQDVWIGMRRSSRSGEWYWLNDDPVNDTNWEDGEPGTVHDGQCAIMSLEPDKDFGWRDEDCCKAAHPICYSPPILFHNPAG